MKPTDPKEILLGLLKSPETCHLPLEHLININGQNRRCDVVVIDSEGKPILIVECKAHHVKIDEKTFLQTSNYVQETGAKYFWMTNGQMNVFMETGADVRYLSELPEF